MAHWNNPPEPETGDGRDETFNDAVRARKWLRREVSKRAGSDPLCGMLADLELSARGFYLGMDYDDDTDDVDEMGPF